jgi:hypothetical protein
MSDDSDRPNETDRSEAERQEAGAREQGTLSEHSEDLSSPQLTVPADEDERD